MDIDQYQSTQIHVHVSIYFSNMDIDQCQSTQIHVHVSVYFSNMDTDQYLSTHIHVHVSVNFGKHVRNIDIKLVHLENKRYLYYNS